MTKKIKKIVKFVFLILLGIFILGLIGAVTPTKWFYEKQSDCSVPIYVSSLNRFHAEIVVPVRDRTFDWRQHLDLEQLSPDADRFQYLSFGWGDRKFFMNASFDPLSILDVLFLPGPSVIHVWGHPDRELQLGANFELKQVNISQSEYLKLAQFINNTFDRKSGDRVTYLRQGFYPNSGFYEARGRYSVFRTCNSWTAEALRVADVNTPLWSALAPAVMGQIKSDCTIVPE